MILVQTLRLYLENGFASDVGWFAALADHQMRGAIAAMHADPTFAWTLQDLAQHVGMSRSTFAQRFRDRVGETPIGYLTRWRMMLAGEQLIHGSEHAFNTAFRRTMGCSPRRYAREAVAVTGAS